MINQKRSPAGNHPAGAYVHAGRLCVRITLAECRHDVIRVEPDVPAHRLDDDGGQSFRYRGLLLLHREIRPVPFLSQIRYRVPPGLPASFILSPLALQFRLERFHPRQRREIPLRGIRAGLIAPGRFLDARLKVSQFLRFRLWRNVVQLAELDFLLLRDNQRLNVLFDWGSEP